MEAVKYNPYLDCQCGEKVLVYSSPPAKNGMKTRYHRCPVCGARVKSEDFAK